MAGEPRVTRSIEVRATPDDVWRMLAEPDALSSWFGGEARLDLRPGGTGRLTGDDGEVRLAVVEEVEAPRRLVFSWWPLHRADGSAPGPHDRSRVTITIEPGPASDAGDDRADPPVHVHVDEEVVATVRRPVAPVIGLPRGAGIRPAGQPRARAASMLVGARA
ncbi:MAG TPA: SRPBCC domain-containing protein [Acidimicrobiia bacterium]